MMSLAALGGAVVLAVITGFGSGSILAMLASVFGAAVAGWGFWKGTQQEAQTGAALSILLLLANLAFAALMLILKIVDWL
jgi:hypothetical protein